MEMTIEMKNNTTINDGAPPTTTTTTTANNEAPPPGHRIDLEPAFRVNAKGHATGRGKARMVYNGEVIGESKEPAFAAARWLLEKGLALPSDLLTTFRNGKPCIYTRVGRAAKLTVSESGKSGPRIVAYREPPIEALRALRATPSNT